MKKTIFDTDMVKATLNKQKTQMRIPIKLKPGYELIGTSEEITENIILFGQEELSYNGEPTNETITPPYKLNDIIYVQESFGLQIRHGGIFLAYKADNPDLYNHDVGPTGSYPTTKVEWQPASHMKKHNTRLFLKINALRIERLQQISLFDVWHEGTQPLDKNENTDGAVNHNDFIPKWDSLIKTEQNKYSWNANPWVYVYTFEITENPIHK